MISEHAKDGIHRIFSKAAKSRLVLNPEHTCDIEPLTLINSGGKRDRKVVVLTITSIAFKLLLILHVDENDANRDYYLGTSRDRPFNEAIFEIANMTCGAMNQELLRYFPDLGMSTPYALDSRCVSFLDALKPEHVARYALCINGSVHLAATICVIAHAPVDFVFDNDAVEEQSGELELF